MGELLKRILPLALAAAVNPTVLAVVVAALIGSRRKATALCLGFTLAFAGIGVVVLALGLRLGSGGHSRTSAIIDLVVAGLLLVLAARTLLRRRGTAGVGPERPQEKKARPQRMGAGGVAAVSLATGLALGLTDLSSLIPYGVALKDMSTAHLPGTDVLIAEVVFLAIAILPVWTPVLATVVAPRASTRALAAMQGWLKRHGSTVGIVVSLVLAAYLLVRGVRGL